MKKILVIVITAFSIGLVPVARLAAQDRATSSQRIETLKKRQQELKRQIEEELERQNEALEAELNQLKRGNARAERPVSAPSDARNPVVENSSISGDNNHGTGAPADASVARGLVAATEDRSAATADLNATSPNSPLPTNAANNPAAPIPAPANPPLAAVNQLTGCALVLATPAQYSRAERDMCGLAQAIVDRRIANRGLPANSQLASGIDPTREDLNFLMTVIVGQLIQGASGLPVDAAVRSFVLDVEAGRTDKQLGSDSRASGTTSLGVKGGIPQVLSWGVENGAAVASRDGTTITFRVNPVGAVQALAGQGYISGFTKTENDPIASFLRRTSVGFSFDTTRGTDPPTLIGSKQQLSAVSFRYQFVNQRDPRASRYKQLWDDFFSREGLAFATEQTTQFMRIQTGDVAGAFRNPNLRNWLGAANTALQGTTTVASMLTKNAAMDEVRTIIAQQLAQLPASELKKDLNLTDALSKALGAYGPYLTRKKEIMDEIAKGTLVTFEYTNYREPNAPDLSNLRFIAEKGTLGGIDITANASLTFFNKRPAGPNVQRIRDFDFSAQLDKKLEDVMGLGPSTFSFTGKYQRLTSDAVAFDGTVLPNTRGDIAAGQLKLTIPIKDTGLKIPFSLTFSNRTELVREKEVRGNFGFTFDLDTLFAKFKP